MWLTILLLMTGFGVGVVFIILAQIALLVLVAGLEGPEELLADEGAAPRPMPSAPTPPLSASLSAFASRRTEHIWFPAGGSRGDPSRAEPSSFHRHPGI